MYIHVTLCLQRNDLLQLMIDASDSEGQKGLEKGEIIADCLAFILAGYETTSATLAFVTYLLAANPEAQERLANEIHDYFEENPVSKGHALFCTLHGTYDLPFNICRASLCMKLQVNSSTLIW